jgi:hypothetical protein
MKRRFNTTCTRFHSTRAGAARLFRSWALQANGMSNNFPKVSPDGRWIVFVQNKNGLLMRPDSKLFIVPFEGGKARLMNCNTVADELVAHVFAQRALACVFVEGALALHAADADAHRRQWQRHAGDHRGQHHAANRAVNIPEFVNMPQGGLEKIDPAGDGVLPVVRRGIQAVDGEQPDSAKARTGGLLPSWPRLTNRLAARPKQSRQYAKQSKPPSPSTTIRARRNCAT